MLFKTTVPVTTPRNGQNWSKPSRFSRCAIDQDRACLQAEEFVRKILGSVPIDSLINKKILARSVRWILGYIEVAEPEYALSLFKLALVFEILSAKILSEKCK